MKNSCLKTNGIICLANNVSLTEQCGNNYDNLWDKYLFNSLFHKKNGDKLCGDGILPKFRWRSNRGYHRKWNLVVGLNRSLTGRIFLSPPFEHFMDVSFYCHFIYLFNSNGCRKRSWGFHMDQRKNILHTHCFLSFATVLQLLLFRLEFYW